MQDGLDGLDGLGGQEEWVFSWADCPVRCDGVTAKRGVCSVRAEGGRVRVGVRAGAAAASSKSTVA